LNALNGSGEPVLTSDYETTAWLRFYARLPVIQVNEEYRYPQAAMPSAGMLNHPLLYLAEQRVDKIVLLRAHFTSIRRLAEIDRKRGGIVIARYDVYRVAGLRGAPFGKMP
jgi:hypothetical protein